jgi:hypothetical protein
LYYIEGRTDIFYYIEGRTYRLYYLKGRTDIFYYIEVRTDTIRYTVYNCPDMEKYRVNKIHIGNFIDPIVFVLEYCTLCSEFILILQPNLISNVFHIRTTNLS